MLEIYIKDKETLDIFRKALQEAGLEVRSRKFYGFRLRAETAVVEVTLKNAGAIAKAIAAACARNPEGQLEFKEYFVNNTAVWSVGPTVDNSKVTKPGRKK